MSTMDRSFIGAGSIYIKPADDFAPMLPVGNVSQFQFSFEEAGIFRPIAEMTNATIIVVIGAYICFNYSESTLLKCRNYSMSAPYALIARGSNGKAWRDLYRVPIAVFSLSSNTTSPTVIRKLGRLKY